MKASQPLAIRRRRAGREEPQQAGGDGHPQAHGELHHHRQQAVAAAGELRAEILQGQGIHGGELQRVDGAEHHQPAQQHPVGELVVDEGEAGDHHPERQGVADQDAAIADARNELVHQRLGQHGPQHGGDHGHPRLARREAEPQLQKQRGEKRHGAAAEAGEQVAPDANGEGAGLEQPQPEQRLLGIGGVEPVARHGGQPEQQGKQRPAGGDAVLPQPLQAHRHQHHAGAEHHESLPVELGRALAQVRHEEPAGDKAEHPHRQVDEKHPVPARHFHQPAPQCRANERPHQAGDGDERHHPQQLVLAVDPQYRQPADRHQQGATDPLQHPGGHQHRQGVGGGAGQRAQGKQQDGGQIDAAGAESVRQPAGGGNEQRHRQHVGDDHRLHLQRALAQGLGHAGQGGVEDGAIQRLHEETDRRERRQPFALGRGHHVCAIGHLQPPPLQTKKDPHKRGSSHYIRHQAGRAWL